MIRCQYIDFNTFKVRGILYVDRICLAIIKAAISGEISAVHLVGSLNSYLKAEGIFLVGEKRTVLRQLLLFPNAMTAEEPFSSLVSFPWGLR